MIWQNRFLWILEEKNIKIQKLKYHFFLATCEHFSEEGCKGRYVGSSVGTANINHEGLADGSFVCNATNFELVTMTTLPFPLSSLLILLTEASVGMHIERHDGGEMKILGFLQLTVKGQLISSVCI